ncbi:MAG: chromate transporter [Desulfobacterales bacterium]|nr:chromate transporter [Desulfobacterales bacterium]
MEPTSNSVKIPPPASFKQAMKFWARLGFISFGGPAGQIAMMHHEVVERRDWIGENQFLRALNFCMLLPGPEAQQLATYNGWRLHGTWGGLAAGALFVIPSIFIMLLLSYINEVAVGSGWISSGQMLIGLGLAETTPGQLIMVTQYVGFLGAWNLPGGLPPLITGILGALVTTYVTFLPCFFFIFAGAPFIETMAGNQRLQAALTGVTAAVVGVVLNLAVWFGYKVILPENSLDVFAMASAVVSLVLLQKFHFPIHYLVPVAAATGIIWRVWL